MKYILTPDLHITGNRPVNRQDNYWHTVLKKVEFILKSAHTYKAGAILSPGDVTDTPNISYQEFCDLVDLFKNYSIPFITTFGQHDMRYRTKDNTAMAALHTALDNFSTLLSGSFKLMNGNKIYGCSYNEDPVVPDGDYNILLIHRMLINKKIWHDQSEFEYAGLFLRDHKYNLIVSGDNHQSFETSINGKYLFNCGTMMRNKITMIDYKPHIILFDTVTNASEKIYFPIQLGKKVFDMGIADIKERNENLSAFVSGLSEQKEMFLKVEDNLIQYIKENKIEKVVGDLALKYIRGTV